VPVVRDCDAKNVIELAREMEDLAERTRARKARPEELRGSTFTITSLGKIGGILATPIINYPEVAILGIHAIKKRPVVRDDEIVIAPVMNVSCSLDHRVVDGFIGAEFVQHVRRLLETPRLLLVEGV